SITRNRMVTTRAPTTTGAPTQKLDAGKSSKINEGIERFIPPGAQSPMATNPSPCHGEAMLRMDGRGIQSSQLHGSRSIDSGYQTHRVTD
ncbi:MAG TPA: hypothetical protein VJ233_09005, partial [Hyphomicrobiaceae bacterium]|nr:hypothetical protein [Hyphomicrobiaceae bacterium]